MSQAISTAETPGAERVRFRFQTQDVLLVMLGVIAAAAPAAAVGFGAWLGNSMVQVREDIVHLRSAVAHNAEAIARNAEAIAHNAEAIAHNAEAIERNAESLKRIEALLLAERNGGEAAPRR
ncbi:MAG: hypothetical protein OXU53_05400 [Deltaproteobacteria bacterium]|nr:hypothetical protein [Deltaproteobacteria bacterium]